MTDGHPVETATHLHCLTAFMVIVTEEGNSIAVLQAPDGAITQVDPDIKAVKRACHEILDDINNKAAGDYAAMAALSYIEESKKQEAPAEAVKRGLKKRGK